ncbi:hypothetical protein [Acholeplasma hippikon]|uniref:The GLUG motif n=1 Tax=Acholeplasma hippikon TaxID=264636 RepID=A0A449BKH6_9MOLU|nr:hypothetical protein [Acholeplasma hippikon]VEU82930.1 Uncharacterised protein [Acholeplasma hippikon]
MKKLLSIFTIAVILVLAACAKGTKSNARATLSNYIVSSQKASFRVEVKDPDGELDNRLFDIKIVDEKGKETVLEDQTINKNQIKNFDFENLERTMNYTVIVTGSKDDKEFQLAKVTNAFKTLAQGDVEEDPLLIKSTSDFLNMQAKKHYRLDNDLDFENESFEPLFTSGTPFAGTFDGNGKTIKNIKISAENDVYKSYLSVFGYASKSKIKNVTFDNVTIDNDAKPYTGIHYVAVVVSKVSNNEFELDNVTVSNSTIKVRHNINQSTTNRNLYVGLVGGSIQGKISNVTVVDSKIEVSQGGVNGVYAGTDISTAGTYVGGVVGLMEQDKGFGMKNIAIFDTEVNVTIAQDKKGNGSGQVYVGGIFGANRSDRSSSDFVSNATINVIHTKHVDTETEKLDVIYVGGIAGNLHKSNMSNAFFGGQINVQASHELAAIYASFVTPYATKASSKLITSGTITITTENGTQTKAVVDIYGYQGSGSWNKFQNVKRLAGAVATVDGNAVSLSDYELVNAIADFIDSEFVLTNYNK